MTELARAEQGQLCLRLWPLRHDLGAREEVGRTEDDGVSAVLPGSLERVANATVVMSFESIEGERRAQEIATQSLELGTVGAVDGALGVDVGAGTSGSTS